MALRLLENDLAHLLLALVVLLTAAHVVGYVFELLRQPRVIGEICGGLLLGPTGLGAVAPGTYKVLFGSSPEANLVIFEAIFKLGLILLLFCSGMEIRQAFQKEERRTALWITVLGTVLPFGAAWLVLPSFDMAPYMGDRATPFSFNLVIAVAVAVTSIPVISKIFMDLGLLGTPFARIVLSAAVLEDIVLYVVVGIALASAKRPDSTVGDYGLGHWLGLDDGSRMSIGLHVAVTLAFFVLVLRFGPQLFAAVSRAKFNLMRRGSQLGYLLAFLLVMSLLAMTLGVNVMFGAFVAGMAAAQASEDADESRKALKDFSSAFFIPIYFAIVGLKLDLLRDFPMGFFLVFTAAACAVKAASVWIGAKLAGCTARGAWNLAIAMNARGGPGIVLASLAYDARIVNEKVYVVLVLLAILTSLLAGAHLVSLRRRGAELL